MVALLDKGPETVRVFASELVEDGYSSRSRRPVEAGVDVAGVFMLPGWPTEDSSGGQNAPGRYTVLGPDKATRGGTGADLSILDAYSEVEWPPGSGRRFDVVGAVALNRNLPKLAHYQAQLVER